MSWVRRCCAPVAVLLFASALAAAGVVGGIRLAAATAGGLAGEPVPQICAGDTLDGAHTGGGSAPSHFGRAFVPAGASINFRVSGEILPSRYVGNGRSEYKFHVRVRAPGTGASLWSNWNYHSSDIYWGPGPYPWEAFGTKNIGTWTNNTGTGTSFSIETWAERSYAGAGANWSITATVSGGVSPPCRLVWDEADVPNPAEPDACGAQPGAADPVNVVQGNFWDSWTDLAVPGRGPGLALARTYSSSRAANDGPFGYGWSSSYDMALTSASNVTTVRQETGAVVRFAAANGGWVTAARVDATLVKEPDGSWTFTRGGTEVFRFSSAGVLTSIADLSGNTTTLGYTSGQLTSVTDASGRALALTWTSGRITQVEGPDAVLATGTPAVPMVVTYAYDGDGNLASVTDTAGGIWTYTYAADHRMLTVREPRHHALGGAAPVVENHYDGNGRVDWQEDRLDRRTTFAYATGATTVTDPAGNVVVYEHTNDVCTGIVRDPGPNQSRWAYEVDLVTLDRTKVTDPNGNVTTAAYDDHGRLISTVRSGQTTEITYNALGLPETVEDPSGTVTTYTYDTGTDRLRTVSTPVTPGVGSATTTMNYDDPANPGLVTSVVDVRGETWTMAHDADGNVVSSTDPTGRESTTTYNGIGWPLSTVAPEGNAVGGTPAQHRTSQTYNARGELLTVTDPTGATSEYDRDPSGNVVTRSDPVAAGVEQTDFTLDAAGELVTITRAGGSTVTTEYWPDGQVKTQRDGATNATAYTYDTQGRLATVTDPAARTTTYRYDAGGRLTSKQQPGGDCLAAPKVACISYGYDVFGSLTSVDHSDAGTPDVTYGYDSLQRRTTMTDSSGVSTWSWDSLGRLLSFADPTGTVAYTFTDHGAGPTTVTYPGGKAVTRTYDDAGRQVTSTDWTGGTATYGYDANANLTTVDTGATTGVEDTYGYDRANRVTALTVRQGTNVLAALGYSRDPEGMVTATTSTGIAGAADTYGYGPFDQLASTTAGAYTYDAADNLTGFPDGRRQRFSAANELCYTASANSAACGSAPVGATTYEYDGRGNRTAARPAGAVPTTLAYDQADRLVQARVPSMPDGSGQYHDLTASPIWLSLGTIAANQVKTFQITGANGVPAAGVESVVVRLHVADPANYGALTVFPTGGSANGTAAMYLNPGEEGSNIAVAKLSVDGKVSVQSSIGTGLSIELLGWYGSNTAAGGLTFEPVTPARAFAGSVAAASTTTIPVAGSYGVPATGASAVAVVAHNSTAATSGYLTVFSGSTVPGSVTLLYDAGTASAMTIVPVGGDGSIKLHSSAATTAAVDIVGYYTAVETGNGNVAHTVTPSFIADTANHTGTCDGGTCNRLVANTPVTIDVTGAGGIPASGVAAVAVVLQAILPDGSGTLTSHATGTSLPATATMTFDDAYTSAAAIVPVGADGTVTVSSSVGTDLLVQAVGYFDAASKTYTYSYAGDGLRRSKTGPDGTVTTFTWDRSTSVPLLLAEAIDEPGTANDRTVRYIYGPTGTVTADVTTMTVAGTETRRWYHADQLGSTSALTSSTGAVLATYSYGPFGTSGTVVGSATTPIGWAGEYRDAETGFVYLRARYYDPTTAQFLTRDPLEALTRSAYGYVENNPLNLTDPTGMCPWCIAALVGAVGGAAFDLGSQVIGNLLSGCDPFENINWRRVAISAAIGGALGGAAHALRAARTAVTFRPNTTHIFRAAPGHLAVDNPANRALLANAVKPANFVGTTGPNGMISVYRQLLPNGTQVWVEVRGRTITNGGVNLIPK